MTIAEKRYSILVIDDVEAERTLISTYLQQQGHRLYQAHDGLDGIHKARLLIPDLILMDADMPHCSGFDACKILTRDAQTQAVPIVFLSAYADAEQRVQGLLTGAVDYIGKPFDFDEVRLRVQVHLSCQTSSVPDQTQPPQALANTAAPEAGAPEASASGTGDPLDGILFHSARVHLLSRMTDPPSMPELAGLVGTNSKRLNAAFKNQTGTTVFGYLREERMQQGRQLLQSTDTPISAIAEQLGFSSCANFSTAFGARFGTSPSRFRQQSAVATL